MNDSPRTGSAFGAVSILNAIPCGSGCSLAIDATTQATWTWRDGPLVADVAADDALVRAVAGLIGPGRGAQVTTTSPFPPSRGLKTSSSVAAALVRAAGGQDDVSLAVEACRRAGVTITGALDDQVAVCLGGAHLTAEGRVVRAFPVPPWHVAVWVPEAHIPKSRIAALDHAPLRERFQELAKSLRGGDLGLAAAMTENGRILTQHYAQAGLPVTAIPANTALAAGALGAGLSGTGPATAAIFERRTNLPPVPGGRWVWHRAVEAA